MIYLEMSLNWTSGIESLRSIIEKRLNEEMASLIDGVQLRLCVKTILIREKPGSQLISTSGLVAMFFCLDLESAEKLLDEVFSLIPRMTELLPNLQLSEVWILGNNCTTKFCELYTSDVFHN